MVKPKHKQEKHSNPSQKKTYWFKPKRFGYGATPNTWQGWIFVLILIIALVGIVNLSILDTSLFYILVAIWILVTIVVSKAKTDGEWKWRWG